MLCTASVEEVIDKHYLNKSKNNESSLDLTNRQLVIDFFKKEKFQKHLKYIILACFIFGIIIEILQGVITSYRTASYLDILANTIGVLLAVVIFHVFEKKINVF